MFEIHHRNFCIDPVYHICMGDSAMQRLSPFNALPRSSSENHQGDISKRESEPSFGETSPLRQLEASTADLLAAGVDGNSPSNKRYVASSSPQVQVVAIPVIGNVPCSSPSYFAAGNQQNCVYSANVPCCSPGAWTGESRSHSIALASPINAITC